MKQIVKRDGRKVAFEGAKIENAIAKALSAAKVHDVKQAKNLAKQVEDSFAPSYVPTVEEVQDKVEAVLIENGLVRTAKEYILYRAERTRIRETNTRLIKTLDELTFKEARDNDVKRENANIDGDTAMGTMLKYGSESAKQFYEMCVLNPKHSEMHKSGDIHIHDLDFLTLTTTCCQIDLDKLFTGGFSTGHGFLREPNHIASYASLACIAVQSNQNDQHGGQSIPNFDYDLAPGVAKTYAKNYRDNLGRALELLTGDRAAADVAISSFEQLKSEGVTPVLDNNNGYAEKEAALLKKNFNADVVAKAQAFALERALPETDRATYQAMEALVHNLNTMHSRAGAQIPFSSINYGTDTSSEGRMLVKNLLKATESGLGNGETPIFPIQIFKVKEGVNYNPGDPNYDLFELSCKCSAKRLFPNFSFIDAPFNLQYYKPGHKETEIAYMGCRTRVIGNSYDPENEIVTGRGNLSFTSVNLPRLAIKSKGNVELFFEQLDRVIDVVIEQLLERLAIQSKKKVKNYPFLMGQGVWLGSDKLGPEDTVGEVLKQGTLTCGFIGLAECLKSLIGKHHGESEEAQNLGLEIVGHMRKRMDEATEKTGLNFSLIATPAEGLSGRFVRIDAKKYGKIPGVTDRDYYTNSFHVPVYYKISAFDKIRLEAPYHALTNGGHISYVELDGDTVNNVEAFMKVIRYMKECNIGYGSINHPVDRDPYCGYTGVIGDTCPKCGRKESEGDFGFERIRRITGYLVGTLERFNNAKAAEERDRVKHGISKK
ncbi:anaerobic ribonucleoside triphosphate reductase [Pumilibacter intestinalis]|uniref:anaerobic ribonucleoside triphosphate reductase n=1 Tax=Pumilibacter intestinalis TaxID=2941511 RepID=UPI00203D15BE|nr:anaerobic ribonucleoside triphosphate reductase [Pumilibacter intestinalis]